MPAFWTNRSHLLALQRLFAGQTLKLMFLKSSYTPNFAINVVSDIVAHECDVSGYSRQTLTGVTVAEFDSLDRARVDAADPTPLTLGAGNVLRHVAVYEDTGDDATSTVHLIMDMGAAGQTTDGTPLTLAFSASGFGRYQN